MIVLGIDPGNTGGLVCIDDIGDVAGQWIMPTVDVGTKKKKRLVLDIYAVEMILMGIPGLGGVAIEFQQPFPKQGLSSTGKLMRAFGQLEGIVMARGHRYELPRPAQWQKVLAGVEGEGKQRAAIYAARRLPDLDLYPGRKRKPHDGLADAACIALWMHSKVRA